MRLEVHEFFHGGAEGAGDTDEHVDAYVGGAAFNLPKIRSAGAGHQGEPTLGDSLSLPRGLDFSPEGFLFAYVVHLEKFRCANVSIGSLLRADTCLYGFE